MLTSRIAFVLAVVAAVPCAAMAGDGDEVVTSASRAARPPAPVDTAPAKTDAALDAPARPEQTPQQAVAWLSSAAAQGRADTAATGVAAPASGVGSDGRTIHGGAGVSIGTGGYRSGYVYSLIPVGDNGTLGVAFSQTDFGKNNVGYYGYDGYGRGWGRRGGSMQSMALSFDMDNADHAASDTPEDCAPGFRDGGRYIEPVWVTRMRGSRDCDAVTGH